MIVFIAGLIIGVIIGVVVEALTIGKSQSQAYE